MGKAVVARAFGEIRAALAVLNAEVDGAGAEAFSAADPLAGLADACLEILAGAREAEAGIAAVKAKAAVTYADTAYAVVGLDVPVQAQEMAVAAEIGCVLALGPRAAGSFLATSHAVMSTLPRTLEALQAGTVPWQHAVVMADETACLDAAGAAALEAHFLDPDAPDPARGCSVGQLPAHRFRVKARTWRERHQAESIEKRHAKGVADRRVEFRPDQDGMAWLSAYLPADQALAGWNRLTATARGRQGAEESRTLTQLRADTFAGAVLGSGMAGGDTAVSGSAAEAAGGDGMGHRGLPPSIRAQVLVTVPVFSLMGKTDEPAVLDGYGPIPPSMARELVANGAGAFYRVLVDPRDGAPLEIGRTSYRVTGAMRSWLRMRTGSALSLGAATTPWTTTPTTSSPGPRAAPPGSATWDSPAPNTTNSATPPAGNPPPPPRTNHQAGPHHRAATTRANTRTGNHHAGPLVSCRRRTKSLENGAFWKMPSSSTLPCDPPM